MTEGSDDQIDRLIHEPARLTLMTQLSVVDEADFVFLQRRTGMTPGNMSAHVGKLVKAGYVEVTKTFADNRPRTIYSLTGSGRHAFESYLIRMRSLLDAAPG
jgi:DNA-binding MarR family transcriptional regulator